VTGNMNDMVGLRRETGTSGIVVDLRQLRLMTIIAPILFLLAVEAFSLLVLRPALGGNTIVRLIVVFAILTLGVVPFSRWVFATIERQQQELVLSATLVESVTGHAIFMLDPTGRVVTWNAGAERIEGYRADEIIGQHIARFYPPEDVERGLPNFHLQVASREGRLEYEGWRVRKDGTRFWANVVISTIRNPDGKLLGFAKVTHDMTERKHAEERIQQLNAELEGRVAELAAANQLVTQHNRALAAVNAAIVAISSALEPTEVLQRIVDTARELIHAKYAALGVANEEGRIVQFVTAGITPEERAAIGPLPQGHGLLGVLIQEGKPLRIPDISKDPRHHGFPPNHPPMKSLLGVPILYHGKPVGDLYLTEKIGAEEFSQEDQDLLMLLANHAAVAITNARLYDEVRTARDQLQAWNTALEATVAERTRQIKCYSKELTKRVLQAQEEERKRIARELHDETAQSLSTLLIILDLLKPRIPADDPQLQDGFERLRTLAKRTLDETRALSYDLRPTILDDVGLIAAIHWYATEHTKTFGVPVEIVAQEPPQKRLPPELELVLFRIVQEALTNSGKHAAAQQIRVTLVFENGMARLQVEDDGKGFDFTEAAGPTRVSGLGLYGMRERAELLGGTLTVSSVPGHGTRVTAYIPLTESEPLATDEAIAGAV
jgi:PAS domain S-box-containing protein